VRMLQDRGLLVQEGARYVVTGDVEDLDVPETLHALVASRLDGLAPSERSLLQEASVLGQAFTAAGAAAITGRSEGEVTAALDRLVAKQVLAFDDDPRSPERGQYVFLQTLLRTVAYGTLSRRVRKTLHVAAARHLRQTWPGEAYDIAEVLASHYLEAIRAEPDADDVAALRASARETLTIAGRAAASLALGPEAQRYFEQAADLAEDELEKATLYEQAGRALWHSGDSAAAAERLRSALAIYERTGSSGGSAVVTLSNVLLEGGGLGEARDLLESLLASDAEMDKITRAEALVMLSAVHVQAGSIEDAGPPLEEALTTLELEQAWGPLADALGARAVFLVYSRRLQEGVGVLRHSLTLGEEHDLPRVALRARFNLAAVAIEADRFDDAVEEVEKGLALARERGDRRWERGLLSQIAAPLVVTGRWDRMLEATAPLFNSGIDDLNVVVAAASVAQIAAARGDDELLTRCVSLGREARDASYVDQRVAAWLILARDALERGALHEAAELAETVLGEPTTGGEFRAEAFGMAIQAAVEVGDEAMMTRLAEFVEELPPTRSTRQLRAGGARVAAELAHRRGEDEQADALEQEATGLLRSIDARPLLARALFERNRRRGDEAALEEARSIYAELGAERWLAQIDQARGLAA
jgi:tetratricopeptide (TPR) repeat protein